MSTQTNIALNARSMNSIIIISDGIATIENGELNCNNINSNTANIQTLTVPTINGDNLNDCTLINCITDSDPIIPDGVANKNYVDNTISSGLTNVAYVNSSNTFSGTNTFNGATIFNTIPTTSIAPTTSNDLCNKNYVDNSSHSLAGYAKLADANIFTANNTFSGSITSSGNNNFTGQNQFTTLIINNNRVRLGQSSVVSADQGIAIGENASATTLSSISIGADSIASGLTGSCTALGNNAKARGVQSTSIGVSSEADHFSSTALGFNAQTTADYQTRIGCIGVLGNKTTTSIATDNIINSFGYIVGAYRDCGVFMMNGVGVGSIMFPMWKSNPDLSNATNQLLPSGFPFTSSEFTIGGAVGTWLNWNLENADDAYIVLPFFSVVVYTDYNYAGTIRLNFYNDTDEAICVRPSTINQASSMRVFYNHVQL